ncbi:PREDICTED: uncharacterized protein C1orf167-like [Lipotes vexillifer]|uniref:Uncharacterized protein C1orf167-like n=1 Tax=Lipotes vexillifer TaxID=118797 RepID=A0A340XV76_LIPVE|nr:PREDICTED: uncharacterized protein C1orf167-like [Lipotes vexillifer]
MPGEKYDCAKDAAPRGVATRIPERARAQTPAAKFSARVETQGAPSMRQPRTGQARSLMSPPPLPCLHLPGSLAVPPEIPSRFKFDWVKVDQRKIEAREGRTGCGVDQGHCHPGFAPEPMELRPDTSSKENVPPRPATPLRPEQWRLRKSLASTHGRWVPVGQAESRGAATTPSPGAALCQEPCRVQSKLTSPSLGLALRDTTGQLTNSSFRQQSNLQPLAGRPQRRAQAFAIQQSNLSVRETSMAEWGRRLWSGAQESFWPHRMPGESPLPRGPLASPASRPRWSRLLSTNTPCPDIGPAAGLGPLKGHTRPDPRSQCGLGGWTSRLVGETLTLEDLAVPAQSRTRALSQVAIHQLLASVQRLEHSGLTEIRPGWQILAEFQEKRGDCRSWES